MRRHMQPFRDYTVYVYMLRCADGSYYVGSTRKTLDERIGEHSSGIYTGYTLHAPAGRVGVRACQRRPDR